jgi:hypothetical protein
MSAGLLYLPYHATRTLSDTSFASTHSNLLLNLPIWVLLCLSRIAYLGRYLMIINDVPPILRSGYMLEVIAPKISAGQSRWDF